MTSGGLVSLALLAAVVAVVGSPPTVSAHARLVESSPAVGEVLAASPAEVSITFSNDIQRIAGTYAMEVANEAGQTFTAGPAVIDEDDRSLLTAPLQPNLAPGRYVVAYKNVSDADGDPFEGGFAFYVGVEPTAEQLAADALLDPPESAATPTAAGDTQTPASAETVISPTETSGGATPSSGSDGSTNSNDDGNDNLSTFVFVGVAVAVAIIAGFVIWRAARGSRAEGR